MLYPAVLLLSLIYSAQAVCKQTCPDYTGVCKFMNNVDQKKINTTNSFNCSNNTDSMLSDIFKSIKGCNLTTAAIDTTMLLGMPWDSLITLKTFMTDEEFFNPECDWSDLAAAMCMYFSLPDPNEGLGCKNATLTRSKFFCKDECNHLMTRCINVKKYTNLKDQINTTCSSMSSDMTAKQSKKCFASQISTKIPEAGSPNCTSSGTPMPKEKSLAGPYVVGGIALAIGIVALLGIILVTCRTGSKAGVPNSF